MPRKNSWSSKTTRRTNPQPVLICIVAVAVFICGFQLFFRGGNSSIELPAPYNPQYVPCLSMNVSHARRDAPWQLEGIHYPNQTLFTHIVESDPDSLVIRAPLIHNRSQIIIVVGSRNFEPESRVEIRRSWATMLNPYMANHTISLIFTAGNEPEDRKCLLREADKFEDLLIVDAADTYRGLVYKMLIAYRYLAAHYKNAHIVKVSKSVAVDINEFMQFMSRLNSTPAVYGYIFWSSGPQREQGGQWYVPKDVFPSESFPPYAIGNFYIITKTAFSEIMRKDILEKEKVIELEDVFITGMLTKSANVSVHWLQEFSLPEVDTKKCPTEAQKKIFATSVHQDLEHKYNEFMDFKERACGATG